MHNMLNINFQNLKHILCYIKETLYFELKIFEDALSLQVCSDADKVGDPRDLKSTFISWRVKK